MNKIQVLDLFSGIGGFSLGLERAGFETVAFCEIDKYCRLVLQKHWKDIKIYSDVREIKKERLEAHGIPSPDVITGGFPCQPFSVAGRRQGTGDNRYLWPEMFRIIKEFKPRWIIAENVRGIINIQDGVVFEGVHADLESQGYETQTFNIPAAGVGAPHRRERVWIVANSRCTIRGQQSTRNKESIGPETSQETKRSADSDSVARSSEREKIMADSKSIQSNVGKINQSKKESGEKRILRSEVGRVSSSFNQNNWWNFEPNVGRVVDGVQGRTHRLKGLGNSIVPQIAEEIGKAILKAEHD